MTDRPGAGAPGAERSQPGLEELTEDILPALVARLRASRLGELEVRTADWRVRVRRDLRAMQRSTQPAGGDASVTPGSADPTSGLARSPAVGYFNPLSRLAVGQLVQSGDSLGSIDVLGIAQDVVAPGGGIVRAILAEPGQAVEYGQPLVEIDALAVETHAVAGGAGMDEPPLDAPGVVGPGTAGGASGT